jgi:hypothetical protein
MSYVSVKAKRKTQRLAESYRSDQIKNFSKIFDGIAVGSGYVFLMGFTIGYQDAAIPLVLFAVTLVSLAAARAISALADLSRSQKRKLKRFLRIYLPISLG